jgi:hypothetical protein
MDETRFELVSRYLDGDLTGSEAADFERRLEAEPELAAQVESAQLLRRAVGSVAARMEPPVELDAVIDPLRRSAPSPTVRVRPLYRWIGVAAALVLGITVTLEVARRSPGPRPDLERVARAPSPEADSEVFQLAPLPTANPDESRPLGAADRLLEEEPGEPIPPEPEALEVLGPLPADDAQPERLDRGLTGERQPPGEEEPQTATSDSTLRHAPVGDIGRGRGIDMPPRDGPAVSEAAPGKARSGKAAGGGADGGRSKGLGSDGSGVSRSVTVTIGGVAVWRGSSRSCAEGRFTRLIVIRGGVVVSVSSMIDRLEQGGDDPCPLTELPGSFVVGVDDGSYPAQILAENSRTPEAG